ncbi:hypothetical protein OOZ51_09695 [Arthrobacter sp. MI7-26]|uniref:hypothetical protein n=1 Tax=Arthrobacter sp. MI7-26 TaxID=2993653 RepID=UPI00224958EE|nr:hypothetical protein [Arthrobacter sp. MI7-26]MCX2748083.1 hypothetical protein [Arthrobacter sp. MI7-26]
MVNFNNRVIPVSAALPNGKGTMGGTAFFVQVAGQVYLTTAAHVATGTESQSDTWPTWADALNLHDEERNLLATVPLFATGADGLRTPIFKYGRTTTEPGILLDLILIPLTSEHLKVTDAEVFQLPALVTTCGGEEVSIAGCREWPKINTQNYTLRGASSGDNLMLYIDPPSQRGESGGPLLTKSGGLLGVNYGADNPQVPGTGLVISASYILHLASAVDGYIQGFQYGNQAAQGLGVN